MRGDSMFGFMNTIDQAINVSTLSIRESRRHPSSERSSFQRDCTGPKVRLLIVSGRGNSGSLSSDALSTGNDTLFLFPFWRYMIEVTCIPDPMSVEESHSHPNTAG